MHAGRCGPIIDTMCGNRDNFISSKKRRGDALPVTPIKHIAMHLVHKLGNAKTESNYNAYYQTLIKDGSANGAISNAYLTSSDVPLKTKCIIMKYRTGTLYNQKHAVFFKLSNLPPLPTIRHCPAHPFWVPTHAKKEHDHQKTQFSWPHDLLRLSAKQAP